jgi:predicted dienelactone hydrolase
MNKWQIALLVLILLSGLVYWFATVPASATPRGSESQARFAPGPYHVITEAFKAVDTSRKTQPNNDFAGRDVRVLKGEIWRPQALKAPGPLLVYSHGFMSFHREGLYLARFLASHGYTVIAVDFPLTNFFAPGNPLISDVVNQPRDVSFLIDTMLQRNSDATDALHNTIDPKKIAVAGVSLGGMTSTLVSFHRKVRDPRITAAISIAGPANMFTPQFFAGSTVPFMMIAGDGDAIVPFDKNAAPIPHKYPGSILVDLKNASHAGFAQPAATFLRFFANPDTLGCRQVIKGLKNKPANTKEPEFMPGLDAAEDGIDLSDRSLPCSGHIPASTMPAAQQHMLTTLAAYSFLQSVFDNDPAARTAAKHYLLTTLPSENTHAVTVTGG